LQSAAIDEGVEYCPSFLYLAENMGAVECPRDLKARSDPPMWSGVEALAEKMPPERRIEIGRTAAAKWWANR